ncbi:MAG: hypothetical protein J5604_03460 [Bacteroidales bacterium]|nr:hypothetical protein [Bacteroidales bacterium]
MKKITLIAFMVALIVAVSCGGNSNKDGKSVRNDAEQPAESVASENKTESKKPEQKVEKKKWWQQDFVITEKMYVATASMTRTYARKGNIVIGVAEGSKMTNLFVCTDSTRTLYTIGNEKGTYIKRHEKSGFSSVDDAVYRYLKDQMGSTVFGKVFKNGEEGTTTRDTVLFGRPAYVITKEAVTKNPAAEAYGKSIMYIDKENGLPYYKWAVMKTNGKTISEGVVFEVLNFTDKPTYEGLIMSLDGLTEIK